jgi:hypothetical protein
MMSDGDNDLLPGIEVEGVEGCYLLKSLYVRGTRGEGC